VPVEAEPEAAEKSLLKRESEPEAKEQAEEPKPLSEQSKTATTPPEQAESPAADADKPAAEPKDSDPTGTPVLRLEDLKLSPPASENTEETTPPAAGKSA